MISWWYRSRFGGRAGVSQFDSSRAGDASGIIITCHEQLQTSLAVRAQLTLVHRWCSHGSRRCRNRECLVDLVEGAAFGFVAEHPEADQSEGVPRGEIYEGRAEHGKI